MVLTHDVVSADILIAHQRVQAVLDPTFTKTQRLSEVDEIIDAEGLVIFPGLIDGHVHFATGTAHCDTLQDVTRAAAMGGITTLIGHVWSPKKNILTEITNQREQIDECPIDVTFHAILTSQEIQEETIRRVIEAGVTSFKFFMAYQDRGLGVDDLSLYQAFRLVAKYGGVALIHAELGEIIRVIEAELIEAGRAAITDYPASRPAETEVEAIRRGLWLAELANCPLYIVHVSTAEGLNMIIQEKERHQHNPESRSPVYAETCPKYVLLNEGAYESLGNKAKVAPPLRSPKDQQALYLSLLSGMVDTLGSDHAPYSLELKAGKSFLDTQTGAPGVQTAVSIMLSKLLEEESDGEVAFKTLQRTMSLRPALIFGLYPRKGWIGPGADADLVFVDPNKTWSIAKDWLVSNSGFSLYEGQSVRGKPIHSLVRGRWVLRNEQLVAENGGQYLQRR